MTFGLKIWNDSGSVQVDDQYKNLALKSKAIATVSNLSWPGSLTAPGFEIVVSGANPVIAFNAAFLCCMMWKTVSGSTHTFRFFADTSVGSTLTYYVFDEPGTPPSSGYGLVVRNAAGAATFDSSEKYLRVVDFVGPFNTVPPSETPHTYSAGRDYAVVQSALGVGSYTSGGSGTIFRVVVGLYAFSATVFKQKAANFYPFWGLTDSHATLYRNAVALVIDVTHF